MPDRQSVKMAWRNLVEEGEGVSVKVEESSSDGSALTSAERTLNVAIDAVRSLRGAFDGEMREPFVQAIHAIAGVRGRLILSGMGKSGLVGRKIAATFASTGTPAMFLHPADASHGDLGMVTQDDVVLILSWSGETSELNDLVSYCRRLAVPIVAITSGRCSTLARLADVALVVPEVEEACPNGLAPTSSTTVQMVLGDALAVALLGQRSFSSKDFHRFHPKGRLGTQLLTVGDLMSIDDAVPRVAPSATILEATLEITAKRFGATAVIGDDDELVGSFTDGDLRRSLTEGGLAAKVRDHMSTQAFRADPNLLAAEALVQMNERKISQIFICRGDRLVGIIHLHDILRAGVV